MVRSPRLSSKDTLRSACRSPNAWLSPATTSGGASTPGAPIALRSAVSVVRSNVAPVTASCRPRQYATTGRHDSLHGRRRRGGTNQLPVTAQDLVTQPLDLRAAVAAVARQAHRDVRHHMARRAGEQYQAVGEHQRLAHVV